MTRRSPATRAELQRAVNLAAIEPNTEVASSQLGVKRQTYEGWLKRAEREGIAAGAIEENAEWQQTKLSLSDQVRELRSQLAAVHRDNLTAAVVRKHILGLKEMTPEPPGWLLEHHSADGVGTPCLFLSDLHWGEVVDGAQLNGVNEYSIAIAQRRLRKVIEKTIYLARLHASGVAMPGIVVNLGGDLVSGDLHQELRETNEMPTKPVLLDLFGVLIWALTALADEFGRVFVPCVAGNHGRNTVKPIFKNRNFSNFDWLLYCLLEKHFASDRRVQFHIPSGADAYYTVAGRRFLLTHGDNLGVKGGDGIIGSLGPILRGDLKIRSSNSAVGQPYDTLLLGHWHQYIPLDRVIVNGSLKGYDEFAKLALRAPPEAPRQALWFVHERIGITSHWPVYAEEPKPTAHVDWVSWPREVA